MPLPPPDEPPPLPTDQVLWVARAIAAGGVPDTSGLSLDDLRHVWSFVLLILEIRRRRGEANPRPRGRRLSRDQAEAFARDVLQVPTGHEIVSRIFDEPIIQAGLAVLQQFTAALLPTRLRPWP